MLSAGVIAPCRPKRQTLDRGIGEDRRVALIWSSRPAAVGFTGRVMISDDGDAAVPASDVPGVVRDTSAQRALFTYLYC